MTEHTHDLDLIAEFASGEPSDDARRLVEACAECRAEFQLQQEIRNLLASLPAVTLTNEESETLHRSLSPLGGAKVISITERRRAQLWLRVGSVAAGIFVVAGLGTVVASQLGGGAAGGDTAFEALSSPTTTAASDFTTAAAAAELAPAGEESDHGLRQLAGGDESAVRAEMENMLNSYSSSAGATTTGDGAPGADLEQRCSDQLPAGTIVDRAESFLDSKPILIYLVDDSGDVSAVVLDAATCSTIDL